MGAIDAGMEDKGAEDMRTDGLTKEGENLIAACELIRATGWVIITAAEKEHRDRWLQESWDRTAELQDQNQRLVWAFHGLLDHATEALAPKRPGWLRRYRSWWHNHGYVDRIVGR